MDERKLLIADDSELNRAILVSVLEKNFDILEAADGKEAIATLAAHEGNIAALLLDVVMPEADGFEVLEEMNRRGWIDEIPTIMISVETGGSYIDRAVPNILRQLSSTPMTCSPVMRSTWSAPTVTGRSAG